MLLIVRPNINIETQVNQTLSAKEIGQAKRSNLVRQDNERA